MARWAKGKTKAQGGTPHKMSKPEGKKGKLTGAMKKGRKGMTGGAGKGSPLDGRKRGKK